MKTPRYSCLAVLLALPALQASAADDPHLNAAYQDHIAYVATFSLPILLEKCGNLDVSYLSRAAPLYLRYLNTHQDQIERGRLLTMAELDPGQSLKQYREQVVASRLSKLDNGTPQEKSRMCEGALGMLAGAKLPGEWPSRKAPTVKAN